MLTSRMMGQDDRMDEIQMAYKELRLFGEVEFVIEFENANDLKYLSSIFSIAGRKENRLNCVANPAQFVNFLTTGIAFKVVPHTPVKRIPGHRKATETEWTTYPTRSEYDSIMRSFEIENPEICLLDTIGFSVNGKPILMLKISDNVSIDEAEPHFLYTSTMHGDETGGFILMLRLIDYILDNYDSDQRIGRLVDNLQIWINPLANPDGTYRSYDSIYIPVRSNANGVDLNRNFPDPADGPHPDGNAYQPETQAMMEFMQKHPPIMSANFHAGAEVLNYPWDTWSARHADDNWFQFISHEYADTVHQFSSGYMTGFNNGITNGYDWYSISGGRQDYVTYFLHGREVTIELDNTKITPEAELEDLWQYNYRSLLNYMEQSLFGIQGTVTDSVTGAPLEARIEVPDHDTDSSHVFSDSLTGEYYRLIYQGTYSLKASAPGYHTKILDEILVENRETTTTNIKLVSIYENDFLSFSIPGQIVPAVIDPVEHTVNVTLMEGTDVTCLVASFTLSPWASATVLSMPQVSGVSINDFTDPVTYTITAGNGTAQDWVVTVSPTGFVVVSVFPYNEDFENGAEYWITNGANVSWQYGNPSGTTINAAASGSNVWMTNLSGDYNTNETSFVYSPVFDLSDLTDPAIEVKVWWDSEGPNDGTCLQYSEDSSKTWHTLMKPTDYLWYNRSDIASVLNVTGSGEGWSGDGTFGTGSNEWVTVRAPITGPDKYGFVRFRFTFASNDSYQNDGFAFDDFKIYSDPAAGIAQGQPDWNGFMVYPNPGNGMFTLSGDPGYSPDVVIEVMNLNGRIIMTRKFPGTKSLNERIDLSSSPKGIYFLRIKAGTHLQYQKIIIQ